jgi:hypothetical protein
MRHITLFLVIVVGASAATHAGASEFSIREDGAVFDGSKQIGYNQKAIADPGDGTLYSLANDGGVWLYRRTCGYNQIGSNQQKIWLDGDALFSMGMDGSLWKYRTTCGWNQLANSAEAPVDPILKEIHTNFILKASSRHDKLAALCKTGLIIPPHFLHIRDTYVDHPEHRERMIGMLVDHVRADARVNLFSPEDLPRLGEELRKDFEPAIEKAVQKATEKVKGWVRGHGGRDSGIGEPHDIDTGGSGSLDLPGHDPSKPVG